MPRLSKIGAAALAAFGWTGLQSVTATYLVVAGGGGGGGAFGGGGGAGGYRTSTTTLNTTLSYAVTVGAGGAGCPAATSARGTKGSDSVFNAITSDGGGGGGGGNPYYSGGSGGSGGGAGSDGGAPTSAGGTATSGQGNNGGQNTGSANYGTGGGGGAGAVGGTGTTTVVGSGGAGSASSISGSSVTYAGGGGGAGGAGFITTPGSGGSGGGGAGGSSSTSYVGVAGTSNLGGGGGAGAYNGSAWQAAGAGGSGVVIISYVGAQQFGGGVVTTDGTNTIHTFTTSGTLVPVTPLSASYLVVAGGGAGGYGYDGSNGGKGGGGGAGGLLTGSGLTLDSNSIYTVTVGAGGATRGSTGQGSSGSNSLFSGYATTAVGGGGGAGGTGTQNGVAGGSGGGGGAYAAGSGTGGTGTSGQGNAGGVSTTSVETTGGGGGAGAVGGAGNASTKVSGSGGAGTTVSAALGSGTYAGGGGGSSDGGVGVGATAGAGGSGGGGSGSAYNGAAGGPLASGTANTGGGGGGSIAATNGAGGSGVVIISYAGSTQQMAGGTVTITGGNVIHTFTSSGYLAPLKLVSNSLRFRSSASAYLNRTAGTPTNANIWTWSAWVKRGTLTTRNTIFSGGSTNVNYISFGDSASTDNFGLTYANTPSQLVNVQSTAVYRDPAAWYHFMVVYDSTSATSTITGSSTDRVRLFVNGVQITSFTATTPPSQNTSVNINTASAVLNIGRRNIASPDSYLDGYLAEVNFIDGQALTPNSFGTLNSYGVWQPITYGGSYGTNGFYLPFSNTTSTTTLGYDFSPQGNNWTPTNISLTAGATYDSMTDVPTLTSATAANYCVLNPLSGDYGTFTLSSANLTYAGARTASATAFARSTIGVSSGKWYWEVVATNVGVGPNLIVGVQDASTSATTGSSNTLLNGYGYNGGGFKYDSSGGTSYGATWTNGDVIGVAFDLDAGTITFYKNNVSQGTAYSSISGTYCPVIAMTTAGVARTIAGSINFGQRPFTYTPPSGFVALNTFNL